MLVQSYIFLILCFTDFQNAMSIVVKEITKLFGAQKALDAVSFEICAGEVVGFLGPNGAGKSTMMKIIACYLPQSSGEVKVCGFDVVENPMEIKKRVGYLPENNPLYYDMYIKEYLGFVGGLHKIKKLSERLKIMIEITGLQAEQNKKIGALSKGYRQRVGLAQALIHDPPVLVLDEPTSGLDPNQLSEIRDLIIQIGKEKTVMLSTHIMQEVEAVCSRAIIINRGVIVADGPVDDIQRQAKGAQRITVEFDHQTAEENLKRIKGVIKAVNTGNNTWHITTGTGEDIRAAIFQFAVDNHLKVLTMNKEEKSLEEVFRELTET